MSLRVKILAAIFTLFILLFTVISGILINLTSTKIENLETDTVVNHTKRTLNTMRKAEFGLESLAEDFASWDSTLDYAENQTEEYITNNFANGELRNLGINLLFIFDKEGNLVYEESVSLKSGKRLPPPEEVKSLFETDTFLMKTPKDQTSYTGFVKTENGPLLLASRPILNSRGSGLPGGNLVFGQFYNDSKTNSLSALLETQIDFLSPEYPMAPNTLFEEKKSIEVVIVDDQIIEGYALIEDILGNPIYIVQVTNQRDLNQTGQESLRLLLGMLFGALFILCIGLFFLLDLLLTKRLAHLSEEVSLIWTKGPDTKNVTIESNDEISDVGKSINELLARLRTNREENRQLGVALDQANESTRLKNEFLSMMSHELRTPLNAIIGYTEIMLEDLEGLPSNRDNQFMLSKVDYSSKHLLNLIDEILDIAKIESGRIQINRSTFNLHNLLDNLNAQTKLVAKEKNLSFSLNIENNVPKFLRGDEAHLYQILSNLLTNAIKFTTEGDIQLKVNWHDPTVTFVVEDTGIGIPANFIDDIFLLFRQVEASFDRSYTGSGLGLTIAKKLVDVHQGAIHVESKVGVGSKFTVSLPFETGHLDTFVEQR